MPVVIGHRHGMMKENQISVPMDASLRQFLEEVAAREHRTIAGQVRHLLCEMAAQRQELERVAGAWAKENGSGR